MTSEGWSAVCAIVLSNYGDQSWDEPAEALARDLCADLEDGDVMNAAMALMAEHPFPPRPVMLRAKAVEVADGQAAALWGEVWAEFLKKVNDYGTAWPWSSINWSPGIAPFAAYVGHVGFKELCLCDNGDLPTVQAQLREKYKAWRERERVRRTVEDLPATKALTAKRGELAAIREANSIERK